MLRASASASGIGNWALRPSVSPAAAARAGGGGAACPEGLESLAESGAAVRWVAVSCAGIAGGDTIFSAPGDALAAFGAAAVRPESTGMAFSGGVVRGLGGVALGASGGFGGSACGDVLGGASADTLVRFRLARGSGALCFFGSRSSIVAKRLLSLRRVMSITKRLLSPSGRDRVPWETGKTGLERCLRERQGRSSAGGDFEARCLGFRQHMLGIEAGGRDLASQECAAGFPGLRQISGNACSPRHLPPPGDHTRQLEVRHCAGGGFARVSVVVGKEPVGCLLKRLEAGLQSGADRREIGIVRGRERRHFRLYIAD